MIGSCRLMRTNAQPSPASLPNTMRTPSKLSGASESPSIAGARPLMSSMAPFPSVLKSAALRKGQPHFRRFRWFGQIFDEFGNVFSLA